MRVCAQSSKRIRPLVRSARLSSLWSENAIVCGAIWLIGSVATEATSTSLKGCTVAAQAMPAAAIEPRSNPTARILSCSVRPVVPEIIRIEASLGRSLVIVRAGGRRTVRRADRGHLSGAARLWLWLLRRRIVVEPAAEQPAIAVVVVRVL